MAPKHIKGWKARWRWRLGQPPSLVLRSQVLSVVRGLAAEGALGSKVLLEAATEPWRTATQQQPHVLKQVLALCVEELLRTTQPNVRDACADVLMELGTLALLQGPLWLLLVRPDVSDPAKSVLAHVLEYLGDEDVDDWLNDLVADPDTLSRQEAKRLLHLAQETPDATLFFLETLYALEEADQHDVVRHLAEERSPHALAPWLLPLLHQPPQHLAFKTQVLQLAAASACPHVLEALQRHYHQCLRQRQQPPTPATALLPPPPHSPWQEVLPLLRRSLLHLQNTLRRSDAKPKALKLLKVGKKPSPKAQSTSAKKPVACLLEPSNEPVADSATLNPPWVAKLEPLGAWASLPQPNGYQSLMLLWRWPEGDHLLAYLRLGSPTATGQAPSSSMPYPAAGRIELELKTRIAPSEAQRLRLRYHSMERCGSPVPWAYAAARLQEAYTLAWEHQSPLPPTWVCLQPLLLPLPHTPLGLGAQSMAALLAAWCEPHDPQHQLEALQSEPNALRNLLHHPESTHWPWGLCLATWLQEGETQTDSPNRDPVPNAQTLALVLPLHATALAHLGQHWLHVAYLWHHQGLLRFAQKALGLAWGLLQQALIAHLHPAEAQHTLSTAHWQSLAQALVATASLPTHNEEGEDEEANEDAEEEDDDDLF